jgi:hypothetical protein
MLRIASSLSLVLLLAACRGEPPAAAGGDTAAPDAGGGRVEAPSTVAAARPAAPATVAPPVAAVPDQATAPDGDRDLARLDGYGPLRFGMTPAEVREAWGAALHGVPPAGDADACHYLGVVGAAGARPGLAFMLEGGRFVRYDVSDDVLPAPGGGRIGMAEADLQSLYKGALKASPHHYVDGGKYLAFDTSGVAPSRLVFETDERGVVTEWRVGLSPQADYVEGCS